MTPQQAADGLVELVFPGGSRVLVDFRNGAACDPLVEASVIRMMLDAEGADGDLRAAIDDYAAASGLTASYYLGEDTLIVAIGDPDPRASDSVAEQTR